MQGVQSAAIGLGGADLCVVLVALLLSVPGAVVIWAAWAEPGV